MYNNSKHVIVTGRNNTPTGPKDKIVQLIRTGHFTTKLATCYIPRGVK